MSVRHGAPPDTSGGSGDPPQGVLAFKCSFRQITMVLKFKKKRAFLHASPK